MRLTEKSGGINGNGTDFSQINPVFPSYLCSVDTPYSPSAMYHQHCKNWQSSNLINCSRCAVTFTGTSESHTTSVRLKFFIYVIDVGEQERVQNFSLRICWKKPLGRRSKWCGLRNVFLWARNTAMDSDLTWVFGLSFELHFLIYI